MTSFTDEEAIGDRSEQTIKVVLLGDSAIGKTAICSQLAQHSFPQKYVQTAGVDFYARRLNLPQNTSVLLQIWDVGGHNLASPSMLNTYIFGAMAILFVYDVTNIQSFENLDDWVQFAKKLWAQMEKPFYMGLVGNKTDSEHRRVIRVEKHSKFAEKNALQSHFYVSAKTGDSIELMFKKVAAEILGIQFSRAEQELNINVVQAEIQQVDRTRDGAKKVVNQQNQQQQNGTEEENKDMSKAMEPPPSAKKETRNSIACSIQ